MFLSNNICRICEATDNLIDLMINIRNDNNRKSPISMLDMLTNIASISISIDDPLPKFVCLKCSKDLEFSFKFKRKCEKSDKKLREKFDEMMKKQQYCDKEAANDPLIVELTKSTNVKMSEGDEVILVRNVTDFDSITDYELLEIKDDENLITECSDNSPEEPIDLASISSKNIDKSLQSKKWQDKKTYECFICKRPYKQRSSIYNHMLTHSPNMEFKCQVCFKTYHSKTNLQRHILDIHEQVKSFQCDICYKSFAQKAGLDDHRTVHVDERPVLCDLCPYKAKSLRRLKFHMKLHDKTKPYRRTNTNNNKMFTCEYCGKQLKGYGAHAIHVRSHTGEKPFKCQVCQKSFAQSTGLKTHSHTHTGEKPYECKLCGLKFRQTGQLQYHMLTHTGEKNHICNYCNKAFTLRGTLTVHLRLHTGEKPYQCNGCDMQFHSTNGLKRHKKIHHKSTN